ncbi:MAG: organic solvent tolerance protein OstA [Bacteroidetes bacterium]|nr:organic solvent tolerance protein OstA [Bacteroidota bacterium]
MKVIIKYVVFLVCNLFITAIFSQGTTKILVPNADFLKYNKSIAPDMQRFIGHVIIKHDSTTLYCDSAWLNENKNSVIAYGNVHIRVSDTLNIFGDTLKYDGNTRIGRMKSNARLVDNQTILTSDTLIYNRLTRIAWYNDWGKIVNGRNVLVSKHGYYYTDRKEFFFKHKVVLMNPDYIMHSDTLMYNTITEIAYFDGPSNVKGKEDSIYCENGWYNTKNDVARFREKAKIFHENQVLTGDSMYYERQTGYGQVFHHAILMDTVKKVLMTGNYGEVHRKRGFAFMTDSAVGIMIEKRDSLFIHSDTLKATFDTGQNIKNIFSWYKVKFFRDNLQGMCDSLVYHGKDSTMILYKEPVLWSGKNQLTADSIHIVILNGEVDSTVFYNTAFIISKDDTNAFNQVKGRDMIAYFRNNEIFKVKVLGNAETIYYVRKDDRTLTGINKSESSDMLIFLEKNEVRSITYITKPHEILHPEKEISPNDLKLKDFKWHENRRPQKKSDIFIW